MLLKKLKKSKNPKRNLKNKRMEAPDALKSN